MSADIIPFIEPPTPEVSIRICSFCKKQEGQVRKMFSNGREGTPQLKCICDSCVAIASGRIQAVVDAQRAGGALEPA